MAPQIVFLYATEDAEHLENIKKGIRIFKDQQLLDYWDETMLMAGEHRAIIEQKISASDIIIPLLSADFLADDTCNKYLNLAVTKGKYLLPIVVRACQWRYHAVLKNTEPAPKQDKEVVPVTDKKWNPIADAYDTIATNVIAVVEKLQLQNSKTKSSTETNNRDMPTPNLTFDNGYALLIGIRYGQFENTTLNEAVLEGTLNDVRDLKAHFTNPRKAAYKPENVIALTEENATTKGILTALDDLAHKVENDPDATVILYYSGHGETNGTDYFLVPYDFDATTWVNSQAKQYNPNTVILSNTFAEKVAAIKAKKLLVILDCCHSAAMPVTKGFDIQLPFLSNIVQTLNNFFDKSAKSKNILEKMDEGSGRVIITSCQPTEKSIDLGTNGLFTLTLLKVLGGEENRKKDGYVDIHDINAYVLEQVPKEAQKYARQQHPEITRMERVQGRFIVCAYDIAKAKGWGQDDTITLPPPPDTIEPVKTKVNMDELRTFQTSLRQIIKDQGFAGTPEVFRLIEESRFAYNPATLVTLRGQAAEMLTQLAPAGFLVSVTSFIDSLRLN
ncbi:MAG: caspase family protein [Sphingobacteriales bacterium]|nr:caspase family protein [Sphingobacteriales bacterium]